MVSTTGGTTTRSMDSKETLIISSGDTLATIRIPAITLSEGKNEFTQGAIEVKNIKVIPGHKYNLTLKIYKPCTILAVENNHHFKLHKDNVTSNPDDFGKIVGGNLKTHLDGNIVDHTFICPAANFGYTLDILGLDNSFDMSINGTKIATSELQFENVSTTPKRNIRFAGGGEYGSTGFSQIYNIYPWGSTRNAAYPAVRIVISPNGKVELFGSKTQGTPLFPLEVYGTGISLNTVPWNPDGDNTIIVSQTVKGQTEMEVKGYGRKIINCTN